MMNKLHAIIVVLFSLSMHQANWGMLTVAHKTQLRFLEKYWTSEKISEKIWKPAQFFLKSFGEHSLRKTGLDFCNLRIDSKARVLPHLSYNQKLFVWFGAQDLDVCFLTTLCNGNKEVARMYRDAPINEILEAYAQAKERMKWSPIGNLQEQHYMMLKESHINSFVRAIENEFVYRDNIFSDDMRKILNGLKILNDIDLEGIGGAIKTVTDLIKIYPLLTERVQILYNTLPSNTFLKSLKAAGILVPGGMFLGQLIIPLINLFRPDYFNQPNILDVIKFFGEAFPCASICLYAGSVLDVFPAYRDRLKNNILPNQPTLTDYLKKHGFSI